MVVKSCNKFHENFGALKNDIDFESSSFNFCLIQNDEEIWINF